MSTYTGPSIVDYLSSTGQASDYTSRAALAASKGITGYSGTADQNTQLLNLLRSGGGSTPAPTSAPAPVGGTPVNNTPTYTAPAQNTGTTIAPPKIDNNTLIAAVKSGQVDPNNIDRYINEQILNAYRVTYNGGTGDNKYINEFGTTGTGLVNSAKSALQGLTFQYGGQDYQYTNGGSVKTSTTQNNTTIGPGGTTSQTTATPGALAVAANPWSPTNPAPNAPVTPPAGATPPAATVDQNGNPVAAPAAIAPPGNPAGPGTAQTTYNGPSIVDYLNSTGQPSTFSARSQLAASLGITGYTGTAAQNAQMLGTLRSRTGGQNTSTTTAGATAGTTGGAGGTGTSTGGSPETQNLLGQATAIAKQFGWVAPDPKNSPLNIAADLFKQGLESFGLNDLKTHISSLIKEQTDLGNKQADEVSTVNANPWLTEGERLEKIAHIGDKYSSKLDVLTHQQSLFESDYKTGLDQVQWQVGQAVSAYNSAATANEKIFSEALSIAEKQIDAKNALKEKQIEAASKTTVLSPGARLVDSKGRVIASAPARATGGSKPIVDGSLSLTKSDIDDGKHRLDTNRGTDGYVDPYQYLEMAKKWQSAGGTITGFTSHYSPKDYINPDDGDLVPAWANPNPKKTVSAGLY